MNKWIQNLAQSVQLWLQISAFVSNLLYVYVYPLNSFSTYTMCLCILESAYKKKAAWKAQEVDWLQLFFVPYVSQQCTQIQQHGLLIKY